MNKPQKSYIKIFIGCILILSSAGRLPVTSQYLFTGTQGNVMFATSLAILLVGFYLLYRGLYPQD